MKSYSMNTNMENDIKTFFRQFAMQKIAQAQADPNNPRQVMMALLNHFEEIYPAFSLTEVYRLNAYTSKREEMIRIYKDCFSHLLAGRLP
jgi:hypothetical protein